LVEEGVTILLTTQYLEEADQAADTVALLDQGRIVAYGGAEQLKASVGTEVLRLEFGDAALCQRAARCLDVIGSDDQLGVLEVATDGTAADVHAALGRLAAFGTPAQRISIRRPSLDDVFLSLTGSPTRAELPTDIESSEVA
jgi:ABC-2 type transport system ATP-binding protein